MKINYSYHQWRVAVRRAYEKIATAIARFGRSKEEDLAYVVEVVNRNPGEYLFEGLVVETRLGLRTRSGSPLGERAARGIVKEAIDRGRLIEERVQRPFVIGDYFSYYRPAVLNN